ncbi:hypothetical protein FIU95_13225 [Microbulbifer sp. THAF38]|nr:hypothetical protein FIU95_13225 [Microbulbifer sp. THAF38]
MPRRMLEPEDQATLLRLFRWMMLMTLIITLILLGIGIFA